MSRLAEYCMKHTDRILDEIDVKAEITPYSSHTGCNASVDRVDLGLCTLALTLLCISSHSSCHIIVTPF